MTKLFTLDESQSEKAESNIYFSLVLEVFLRWVWKSTAVLYTFETYQQIQVIKSNPVCVFCGIECSTLQQFSLQNKNSVFIDSHFQTKVRSIFFSLKRY